MQGKGRGVNAKGEGPREWREMERRDGRELTEKSWVACLLCRSDGDEMRVNMILALWTFEKPRPLTFRGIPPLYSRKWHIISQVNSSLQVTC